MYKIFILLFLSLTLTTCGQSELTGKVVGGSWEGSEAIFEYEGRTLSPVDTLPEFSESGIHIKIMGTIYEPDGITPAENVILYFYHTNQKGIYPTRGDEQGWARRHGYIRGWVKTGPNGEYAIYTRKPAPYPNRSEPAHIHITILEPEGKHYWIQSYHFEGDPLLTKNETNPRSPRGGNSGLISLKKKGDLYVGERDIILGKNIPGYE